LGASLGSALKKPGLAPKRLIQSGAVQLGASNIKDSASAMAIPSKQPRRETENHVQHFLRGVVLLA